MGIKISKHNNKYCLDKSLQGVDFNKKDLSIIAFLKKYSNKLNHDELKTDIFEALQVIEQNFSKTTETYIKTHTIRPYLPIKPIIINDSNITKLEKYCKDKLKVKIYYANDSTNETTIYFN